MAADAGTVEINLRARLDQLEADMARARSRVGQASDDMGDDANNRFGKKLGGIGKTVGTAMAVGVGAAAVGLGALFKGAVDAAEESRKVGAQTAAVIASTGGAANVSAAQVSNYAEKLSGLTGIDDELIASGQNLLLTFTQVRNEVGAGNDIFDQGTKAALNMSVALGTDMKSASMLVGKALNDPIAGMTALTKSGITFTAQQKDQVKAMVAAGDTLGAQKVILKELETQFAGSAEAAASPMARLKVVVGNLQEELGARLLPVAASVATFLADNLPGALDAVGDAVARGLVWWNTLEPTLSTIAEVVGTTLVTGFNLLVAAMDNPVFQTVAAVIAASLLPALIGLAVQAGLTAVAIVASYTVMAARAVISGVTMVAQNLLMIGSWIAHAAAAVVNAAIIAAAWLIALGPIALLVAAVIGAAILIIKNWDWIKKTVGNVVEAVVGFIRRLVGAVVNFVQEWGVLLLGPIGAMWKFRDEISGVVTAVIGFFGRLVSAVADKAGELIGFVAGIPGRVLGALGNVGQLLWDAGWEIMAGLGRGIMAGVEKVYNFVRGIAGKIASLKGPLSYDRRLLTPAGKAIMDGLVMGLRAHESQLVNQLGHVTGLIESVGGDGAVGRLISQSGSGMAAMGTYAGRGDGPAGGRGGVTYIVQGSLVTERELRSLGRNGTATITRYNGTPGF